MSRKNDSVYLAVWSLVVICEAHALNKKCICATHEHSTTKPREDEATLRERSVELNVVVHHAPWPSSTFFFCPTLKHPGNVAGTFITVNKIAIHESRLQTRACSPSTVPARKQKVFATHLNMVLVKHHSTSQIIRQSSVYHLSVILHATHKRWVLDTSTSVSQARDRSVVTESLELVLHRLRQHRAVNI